jgi:hypothetical protein
MPNRIEAAPSGRASCRGCKEAIAKGVLRFAEEYPNPFSEDGGMATRYWHLACAATKLANELRPVLAAYEGAIDSQERASVEALVETHARPDPPYGERAGSGRARCRACDVTIKKGELRIAFERVFESPMGPQKGMAYAHPGCLGRYLEREKERGREALEKDEVLRRVRDNSKLSTDDLDAVLREAG